MNIYDIPRDESLVVREEPQTFNLRLLDAALAEIEAHPETWQQRTWLCETAGCLAGHIAFLAGARIDHGNFVIGPLGSVYVDTYAIRALGGQLDEKIVAEMWQADNTLDDLRACRDRISALLENDPKNR